jgi:hypothetical protein
MSRSLGVSAGVIEDLGKHLASRLESRLVRGPIGLFEHLVRARRDRAEQVTPRVGKREVDVVPGDLDVENVRRLGSSVGHVVPFAPCCGVVRVRPEHGQRLDGLVSRFPAFLVPFFGLVDPLRAVLRRGGEEGREGWVGRFGGNACCGVGKVELRGSGTC